MERYHESIEMALGKTKYIVKFQSAEDAKYELDEHVKNCITKRISGLHRDEEDKENSPN